MAATLSFYQSDGPVALKFTVTHPSGTAFDLTGYTVTLNLYSAGNTLVGTVACSVTNAGAGQCQVAVMGSGQGISFPFGLPRALPVGRLTGVLHLTTPMASYRSEPFTLLIRPDTPNRL